MTADRRSSSCSLRRALALFGLSAVLASLNCTFAAEPARPLWQIGRPDGGNTEFAFAPGGWRQFREDGLFIVGESDPKRDWPYVHPGPSDPWAGSTPHTFAILFGLKSAPAGECRLRVALVDTHGRAAPKLRIQVNGRAFEQTLPLGAGDRTINGQPAAGRPHTFAVAFPADLLHAGDNAVQITTVSGCWMLYDSLALDTAGGELAAVRARTLIENVQPVPAVQMKNGALVQPVRVSLRHFGAEVDGVIRVAGAPPLPVHLKRGVASFELLLPAVATETRRSVAVELGGRAQLAQEVICKPVRPLTIYVLPHSHTDIGYTEIQTAIEQKQINNLLLGMAAARRTAGYPEGARFVWNVEVLWAADLYLQRMNDQQRADFFAAVKSGQVALNGMYLNELSGLCRPEELARLFRYSTQLSERCGVPIDSAMISDVPGLTWGTVTAMAQAGIKYLSTAPNWFDRIGDILVQWQNKPFYWASPSGREKVLVWIPYKGYALSHISKKLSRELITEYQEELERINYPYDISYTRWSGHGDNAEPDPAISDFIRDWNTSYVWPKFVIASTSDAFRAFEQRYGDKLPTVRGDWTPYWEDGAGSSALETAMNRASSDRLTQAETLWAMLNPAGYPAGAFDEAWRNVLLYSEHTWGASSSVWDPEGRRTKEQWNLKRSYALQAETQSRDLLEWAFKAGRDFPDWRRDPASMRPLRIDVFNTASWPRTELVTLSREFSAAGDRVTDDAGQPVASQRLSTGELAFAVRNVPAFGARAYTIDAGKVPAEGKLVVDRTALDNGRVRVRIDERTGSIVELFSEETRSNLADSSAGRGLNEYLYLPGDTLADLKSNGAVTITVKERGPLVGSLLITSDAPGCNRLTREVRLVAGADYVELINTVDKQRAPTNPNPGDRSFAQKGGKESVNFAFPFNVPHGELLLDLPLGAMRPERDQLPGACKNWFTVGRWVEVANSDFGVTWVTLDAPLIDIGTISARLLGSQRDPAVWRKKVEPTQTFYSWVMNNHWGTNYRAYQEGPAVFRYILRPHRKTNPAEATRFATGFSQPLIVRPADQARPIVPPRVQVSSPDVVVTALKPSDDGRAWIVRLFGASGKDASVGLEWSAPAPAEVSLSDTTEKPRGKVGPSVTVPGWGLVTLRAEWRNDDVPTGKVVGANLR